MNRKSDGTSEGAKASRRDFLRIAGTAAPAAVAALAVTGDAAEAATPAAEGTGLRDTEHTRAYFDSARF